MPFFKGFCKSLKKTASDMLWKNLLTSYNNEQAHISQGSQPEPIVIESYA